MNSWKVLKASKRHSNLAVTYLSLGLELIEENLLELLELVTPDTAKLFSELPVFVDKGLNLVHLRIQLIEFGVCELFAILQAFVNLRQLLRQSLQLALGLVLGFDGTGKRFVAFGNAAD